MWREGKGLLEEEENGNGEFNNCVILEELAPNYELKGSHDWRADWAAAIPG